MRVTDLARHPVVAAVGDAFAAGATDLFLVGGSVRDALAGVANFADLDFTTSARPPAIRALVTGLGPLWDVGERFGTIGVSVLSGPDMFKVEITTFRTEVYLPGSRKPEVGFGDTIEDDLRRRDLTINAAALCIVSDGRHAAGSVVDPFDGASDLAAGRLRTPDDPARTMDEDPLRQLRVVRFAVTRNMGVTADLAAAIRGNSARLQIISAERIRDELLKITKAGPAALADAARLAGTLDVGGFLFSGLDTAEGVARLDRLPAGSDELDCLAVLATAAEQPDVAMRHLKLANDLRVPALEIARLAAMLNGSAGDDLAARRLVRRLDDTTLERALTVAAAITAEAPAGSVRAAVPAARAMSELLRAPLPIDGNTLVAAGLKGPQVGAALAKLTEAFLADPALGAGEALDAALA